MIYLKLSDALTPITAQPFRPDYREYSPCDALKPYIRCFWTSINQRDRLIIPDLCANIIFDIENNEAFFCGASDKAFVSHRQTETFGIRFYYGQLPCLRKTACIKRLTAVLSLKGISVNWKKSMRPNWFIPKP